MRQKVRSNDDMRPYFLRHASRGIYSPLRRLVISKHYIMQKYLLESEQYYLSNLSRRNPSFVNSDNIGTIRVKCSDLECMSRSSSFSHVSQNIKTLGLVELSK